ncbi:hypothetical protein [Streptomyces sp. NPDC003717]|uniref:hypothetical protein n=1 Tax=Streptomyces sp. NPDC003717 TaxID=3154276 RepID=UPI0033A179C8
MSTSDPERQTFEEQQAAVQGELSARGFTARPAADAREQLDRLLDGRPQLAALALNLVRAALDSGAVVAEGRTWSSGEVSRTGAKSRHEQGLAAAMSEFNERLRPVAVALARTAEQRRAGEKAIDRTPAMILRAKAEGMRPADIARVLRVSDSHVYAVLRKGPTEGADILAQFAGIMAEAEQEAYEARRSHVPPGHTLYSFRIELHDGPDGEGWTERESGDTPAPPGTEVQVAAELLAGAEEDDEEIRTHRARVLIWEGPEGDDGDALYSHDREPDAG